MDKEKQLSKAPQRQVQYEDEVDDTKLKRTLASICGFSFNLYFMFQYVKDVSDVSRLFFGLLIMILGAFTFKERDMSYLFGGLAVFYLPYIIVSAGLSSITLIATLITIIMLVLMRGVSLKSITQGASNAAIKFNRNKMKKRIKELSGSQTNEEFLLDEHLKEFADIQNELDKVKKFHKEAEGKLKNALNKSISEIEELQKDHSKVLMRSANLDAFLKTINKKKILMEKERLEIELKNATDDVIKAQLTTTIKMKDDRLEELKKLDTCLQRVKLQRLQLKELFSGTMDKMNALRFTDIQSLDSSSDAMFSNIKDIRSDLENLEEGLIEAEKFKKI